MGSPLMGPPQGDLLMGPPQGDLLMGPPLRGVRRMQGAVGGACLLCGTRGTDTVHGGHRAAHPRGTSPLVPGVKCAHQA